MSARNWTHPWSLDRNVRHLHGKVVFGASGVVSSTSVAGLAITKPGGTGLYRCTLEDSYGELLGASMTPYDGGSAKGQSFELAQANLATKVVDFVLHSGRRHIGLPRKAADGAANTATAETALGAMADAAELVDAYVIPDAGVTADANNNATLTIRKRDSAGANPATMATLVTDVAGGNWTAFARKAFTISTPAAAAGSGFTLEITKGGTGVQLPLLSIGLVFAVYANATSGTEAYVHLVLRDGAAPRRGS